MSRPHVVVVGAGFAGHQAARRLTRLARGRARITIVNPTDYFLYAPLLPEVATGVLEPRRITVSLSGTLPGVRLVLGEVEGIDLGRPGGRRTRTPRGWRATLGLRPAGARRRQRQQAAARSPGSPATPTGSAASRRRCTCATRSSGRSSSPTAPTPAEARGPHDLRGRRRRATPAPRSPPPACSSPTRWPGSTRAGATVRPRWMLLDVAERVLPGLDPRMSAGGRRRAGRPRRRGADSALGRGGPRRRRAAHRRRASCRPGP